MTKEQWDIYDCQRQLTHHTMTRGDKLYPGQYHLVIHVCYFNHKQQLLIQRRSLHKEGWPGLWDISIGGAVRAGETSQMAASRESDEELGITHDFTDQLPQMTLTFERGFDDIFIVNKDISLSDISFKDHEACDARWATLEEVYQLIDQHLFLPIHSKAFIHHIFDISKQ